MYLSSRAALVRNLSVSVVNGSITLVILLIAPLGLAAVIMNTALVTIASYITATAADGVVRYLTADVQKAELLGRSQRSSLQRPPESQDIERLS